jgi:PiT family inorganic phosphate transporter
MTLFLLVLLVAFVFEYINGFHDSANAIATVVSTKVLNPRQAIVWAAFWNLLGAMAGTAVATTIGTGLVDTNVVTMPTVLAALLSAIIWNLFTWWLGLPSSSSHALVGGLCGAALASAGGRWAVLRWSLIDAKGAHSGLWPKIVLPMVTSPTLGFIIGALLMFLLTVTLRRVVPRVVSLVFGKAQLLSAGFMGYSHGSNDAQKTMGIITMALVTSGYLSHFSVPLWVVALCASMIALGTAMGGWRLIRTLGAKFFKIRPVDGFSSQIASAAVILGASLVGGPVSTTQVVSSTIMGVGASERMNKVRWGVAGDIATAWLLTIPATALLGAGLYLLIIRFLPPGTM